jgi:hypothetical protein
MIRSYSFGDNVRLKSNRASPEADAVEVKHR